MSRIERKLDEILALLKGRAAPPSPQELDTLNWREYPSGEGEWIFADEAPIKLIEALRNIGGSAVIGGYRYTLREGRAKKFVARRKL